MSIRWRLTLWYGLSIAAVLVAFCLLLFILLRQQIVARVDDGLAEEVKEVGLEVELASSADGFNTAAQARFSQHSFYRFLVRDSAGRGVFTSPNFAPPSASMKKLGIPNGQIRFAALDDEAGESHRVAMQSIASAFGTLDVYVFRSLAPLNADLASLKWIMTLLLPVGVAFSLGIGHLLTGRALAPVQQVIEAANSINISCLDRRIDVLNPHDEIGRLSLSLNSLIARLERAVSEIRRFTADASHEIRTPLATLRIEAESALQADRPAEEYRRALRVVVDEATRLSRLTNQLLHLSRFDAGIISSQTDIVQLDALAQDVADQLRPLAEHRGVDLAVHLDQPVEVLGDDIQLSQALFNVLDNAVKYSLCGGRVELSISATSAEAAVTVKDSGIGIPAEYVPHVFDRFFRGTQSRELDGDGTGLGLAIARTAIMAHGGEITLQSSQEQGTVVRISIPLASRPEAAAQIQAAAPER
ncbi:sensor histidine kinase [Lacipirellula sp.]|uniref:sensor histidine kinase n=1 Tax=Lacipirellula sp. TaxID=2691419 RepID=UPI003D0F44E5